MIFTLGPLSFQINLSKNLINKHNIYNNSIEENLYNDKDKILLNIGGGNFKHNKWKILDFYSNTNNKKNKIDILYDLNSLQKLPIENDSVSIIYTSHTIEHVYKNKFDFLFKEFYRIIDKNNGTIRLVYPDIDICYDAYKRNDKNFFYLSNSSESLEKSFVKIFAMNILDKNSGCSKNDIEIKNIIENNNKIDALNILEKISDNHNTNFFRPDYHRSWWNHNLIKEYLEKNNFKNIEKSAFGQSKIDILRNTNLFDNTHPKYSSYTEATF